MSDRTDPNPARPLILDARGLDRYLRQTGRFRMLDGVLEEHPAEGRVVGFKEIRTDDWWAADHVPGRPMFPGVLQIEAGAQLATYDFLRHRVEGELPEGRFVGFGGAEDIRFRKAVLPDCRLVLTTTLIKSSRRMFRYKCEGHVLGELAFEGEVIGVIV